MALTSSLKPAAGHNALSLPSLSIVFPVYNEFDNIARCVGEALEAGRRMTRDLEIIFVDDASTDGSGELAEQFAARHPEIRVLHHARNRKLGGTLRTGFAAAAKEWILYTDSDLPIRLSHALSALPLTERADMVIGARCNRTDGRRRELLSAVYNRLIRVLFGLQVSDVNFAFKLFRRSILEEIALRSEGSFIDAELLIETRQAGFTIAEIPLQYQARTAGASTLASYSVIWRIVCEMLSYRCR